MRGRHKDGEPEDEPEDEPEGEPEDEPEHDQVGYQMVVEDRISATSRQLEALRASVAELRVSRLLTFSDDEHDPDGSTASLDQARDTALLQQTEATLAELLAARTRLRQGDYGICEVCHQPIPDARLRARPEARRCVGCAGRD